MRYRAIQLYFSPDSYADEYKVPITEQVERALEGVPRESIVSISYAPYPHQRDDILVLVVLQEG